MNTAPFYELRTRLYASAASGCGTINEDFRLKRAVTDFEPLAGANKAFMKLYTDCGKLFASDAPADILPDCIALADALAVTQGGFGENTETVPSEIKTEMKILPVPYSAMSALCEKIKKCSPKLTELSSDEIRLLSDGRAVSAFIKASEKRNSYLDALAESIIGIWGRAIVPMLKNAVDITDEKASGARIDYIFMAAGTDENDYYISLAENTEAPQSIRTAAVEAMAHCTENAEVLLELCRTEKGKVKDAAITAVLEINLPEADGILAKLIEKSKDKYDKYARYVRISSSRTAEEFVRAQIMETSETLRSKNKSKPVMPIENTAWLFRNKSGIADCFLEAAELSELWGGGESYVTQINSRLNDVLIKNLKNKDNEKYCSLINELYSKNSSKFFFAYFFMRFIDDPENAANVLMREMKKHHLDTALFLSNIRYKASAGAYCTDYVFNKCYPTSYSEPREDKMLFKSFPDSLLKFMCDPSAYDASSSDGVCKAFMMFARSCSREDSQRINSAVLEFALERGKKYPSYSGLELMEQCCPPEEGSRCLGMMTNYVLDSLHTNHRAVRCHMMERLPMSREDKIKELSELINKTERTIGLLTTKEIKNQQLSYIKNEIDIITKG